MANGISDAEARRKAGDTVQDCSQWPNKKRRKVVDTRNPHTEQARLWVLLSCFEALQLLMEALQAQQNFCCNILHCAILKTQIEAAGPKGSLLSKNRARLPSSF